MSNQSSFNSYQPNSSNNQNLYSHQQSNNQNNFNQGYPSYQLNNLQINSNQNLRQNQYKPQRQKNTLYMSSMQFSHNQNNANRQQFSGVNMKPSINSFGRQINAATYQNVDREFYKQQLSQNQGFFQQKNNTEFQKKLSSIQNQNNKNVHSQNNNQQISKEDQKQKFKKNISQIQAIKRQLQAINGKMKKLGMNSQTGNQSRTEKQQIKDMNPNVNRHFYDQKGQIAHSMIINNYGNSFNNDNKFNNAHNKPLLSLQETYQKLKGNKISDQNEDFLQNKPKNIPSFIFKKNNQNNSNNLNNQSEKQFFNFTAKDKRNSKVKSSQSQLQEKQADKNANQEIVNQNLNIKPNTNYLNLQKNNDVGYLALKHSAIQPRTLQLQNQNKKKQDAFSKFNHPTLFLNSKKQGNQVSSQVSKTIKQQNVMSSSTSTQGSTTLSGAQQAKKPQGFFKKKALHPQYLLSEASNASQDHSDMKKTSSVQDISLPFGQKKIKKQDFAIGKKMGKGQFGQVNLVIHKKTGFVCAMKTMSKKQIRQQKYDGQIARQLSIQFYLAHRNITPLYGYFDDQQSVYLLVQFCPDGHLLGVLRKVRRMQEEQVSPFIKQVIEGIDYIHKQKIIHRDIKPENILFSYGVAKIVDFGWAVYRGLGMRKTASGSPLYYSPQIVMGTQYDQKIDLWDIGMMTYECLIGKVPFKVYTEMDLNRIVQDQVTFPSYVDTTPEAQDFILKILQKKPEDRMTVRQMLRHPFITKYSEKKLPIQIMTEIHNVLK